MKPLSPKCILETTSVVFHLTVNLTVNSPGCYPVPTIVNLQIKTDTGCSRDKNGKSITLYFVTENVIIKIKEVGQMI
jgi:hypothetical protein